MRNKTTFVRLSILALTLAVSAATAQAAPIPIYSAAGLDWLGRTVCTGDPETCVTPQGTTVAITRHSAWQINNPGGSAAVWISYADTGYGGAVLAPVQSTQADRQTIPVMTVVHQLTGIAAGAHLSLNVWADDTAFVYMLQGNSPIPLFVNHTWGQGACEANPIGCTPGNAGVINYTFASGGDYGLFFNVFQVGTGGDTLSNPFGLLYAGELTAPVPEPGSMVLLGTGLVGLARVVRRRKK